jgi:hypothetical protein
LTTPSKIMARPPVCVPKIRFCNIRGEGRRELGVI